MKEHVHPLLLSVFTGIAGILIIFFLSNNPMCINLCYAQETDPVKEQMFKETREMLDNARAKNVHLLSPNNFSKAEEYYQRALVHYDKGGSLKKIREDLNRVMEYMEMAYETTRLSKIVLEYLIQMVEEFNFARTRYFHGMFLDETDFLEEQSYHMSKANRKFKEAAMKVEEGNVKSAKSIAKDAEKEYRKAAIEILREVVMSDVKEKLKNVKGSIPEESYRRAEAELKETEDYIEILENEEFVIGELFIEVSGRIQKVFTLAGIEVATTALPDLVIEQLTLTPTQPHEGEDVEIHVLIRNIGEGPAEDILVRFLAYEGYEVGHATIERLYPNHTEGISVLMTAQKVGECQIIALVDPENVIEEIQENNNEAQRHLEVEFSFFEEYPIWNMPDLAVTDLSIEPERANPGDPIVLCATVSNQGTGDTKFATLVFLSDNVEIRRESIEPLGPSVDVRVEVDWTAQEPGCHRIIAQIELDADDFDRDFGNNFKMAKMRVSGGQFPVPELEFIPIEFETLHLSPDTPNVIPVKVRNPSFAEISNIPIDYYIDGQHIFADVIEYLAPGDTLDLLIPWTNVTPGEHMVVTCLDLPDEFSDADLQRVKGWHVVIPDKTVLYSAGQKDEWVSIGPRILKGGGCDGSVGRIHHIAFHPTNPKIIYASTPKGGVWKTTNGGDSWTALGDKLNSLFGSALAVDPKHPQIIYYATGFSPSGGGVGIYKSIDGGTNWGKLPFASVAVAAGVNKLVIRYTSGGEVMIYAATNRGVLRYKSSDPFAKTSTINDWDVILTGFIDDMVVSPNNNSLLYASVFNGVVTELGQTYRRMDGLYRTNKGESATGNADWQKLTTGLPHNAGRSLKLDIFEGDPKILYASVLNPSGLDPKNLRMGIYRTLDSGDSWNLVRGYYSTDFKNCLYNPFIRVHPTNSSLIYFGGVKLYKENIDSPTKTPQMVTGIHDDMQGFEFDPSDPSIYYILNDGGIWRCAVKGTGMSEKSTADDICIHRNYDLRVTEFYDFDASETNPNLIIGGTQDNGTMIYEGKLDWRFLSISNYGDGYYSLIAPSNNKVMYAQFQDLHSTARSTDGGQTWNKIAENKGLPIKKAREGYIAVHPNNPDIVLSVGDQVYATLNALSGANWTSRGPKGKTFNILQNNYVTHVVFQPKTFTWFAGTSTGQIWYASYPWVPGTWSLMDERNFDPAAVISMAFAPTDHNVLYVAYQGGDPYRRIQRFEWGPNKGWNGLWITDNFSLNREIRVICGDGHTAERVYVGTDRGVFRWIAGKPMYDSWQPYNEGLPLAIINDLLVPMGRSQLVKPKSVNPRLKELRAATQGRGAWSVITGP